MDRAEHQPELGVSSLASVSAWRLGMPGFVEVAFRTVGDITVRSRISTATGNVAIGCSFAYADGL